MKQFSRTTPPLGSDTPNLSGMKKWLDLAAKINLLILAGSLFLVLFVMIFALDPLSEGTYSDPMVVMSASYLLAVLFGILALRQKKALIVVMFAYVAFFAANWLDMKRTEDASLAFCAGVRADPSCTWSVREDGFVCSDGEHQGIIPSNMCAGPIEKDALQGATEKWGNMNASSPVSGSVGAGVSNEVSVSSGWKMYQSSHYGFEFSYPGQWEIGQYNSEIAVDPENVLPAEEYDQLQVDIPLGLVHFRVSPGECSTLEFNDFVKKAQIGKNKIIAEKRDYIEEDAPNARYDGKHIITYDFNYPTKCDAISITYVSDSDDLHLKEFENIISSFRFLE